ncbi:MAG: translocation/assembly module TamB domain-containing protein, partial [Myxococcota bacterium]
ALLRAFSAAPNPWVDFDGSVSAQVSGPLAPLKLTGPFQVDLADFMVRQGPVDQPKSGRMLDIPTASLKGNVTLFKDHIVLDGHELIAGRNKGTVVADIGFGPQGPLDVRFDLKRGDLSVLRPLSGSQIKGTGRLQGRLWGEFKSLQVKGTGDLRNFSVSGIPYADRLTATIASPDMKRLVLTEARGLRGQTRYLGTFSMDFAAPGLPMHTDVVIPEGRAEDLVGMFVDLGDVITGQVIDGSLVLDGPLNDLDGAAQLDMQAVTLVGETFDTGQARGRLHQGTFTLDEITVERGEEDRLTLTGGVGREWALDLYATGTLSLPKLDALAGLNGELGGEVSADLRIDNTLFEPAPHGTINLSGLQFAGQPIPDSTIQAETTNGVLLAHGDLLGSTIDSDLSLGLWGEQPYTLTALFNRVPIDRMYPVAADGQAVEAHITGDLELWGTLGEQPSPPELRARLPDVLVAWDRHSLSSDPNKPWLLSLTGNRWTVRDVALKGGQSALALTAEGEGASNALRGSGALDAVWLPAFVPGLTRSEGALNINMQSGGTDGQSTSVVDLVLDAPLMRHEGLPAALEDVHARARVTPDGIRIAQLAANAGGGRITGDALRTPRLASQFTRTPGRFPAGVIASTQWIPTRYDLRATARDVQMQWVDDLPPAAGNADIAFDGPTGRLLLHADVDVTDMAFTERIDWEDWVVALEEYLLVAAPPTDEPPYFGLDIDIHADRTIRLLNNVSDATASAELTLMGDTSRMGLLGDVTVNDGVVYVQDREFDVQRGELRFDDAFSWDPLVDFDLRADIQSRSRQYRVNYRIVGPYSDWNSRTASEPRLPQSDINALLWFGVTADDLEDMGELTNAVGLAAADFVVKDFVQNDYLGLGLRDTGLWERLPEIDLNTGVNLRGEYSSEPRVLVRQRWSPTLSTLAEINLVRDDLFARVDWRADESLLLSAWYASRRREGYLLPFNGALGVDLRWVQDFD